MDFIAHKKTVENNNIQIQTVAEHCRNAAKYACECLSVVNLKDSAYLAGLLHDVGKCKQEFMNYIFDENAKRGSVNHTFAGCKMLIEHFHNEKFEDSSDIACELIAFAIGAHHGLFDCVDERRKSGFLYRDEKENIGYEESKNNFLKSCADWKEIEKLFKKAEKEISNMLEKVASICEGEFSDEEFNFYMGLLARLLLSGVIEGDRRDTAEFMEGIKFREEEKDLESFWGKYLNNAEKKIEAFPCNNDINRARSKISQLCRHFAENPTGIYRLNVPTGSGKTLSSLRYALAHAKNFKKKRIIFVTPLISILEQNAKIIRDFIGDDNIILEHHSNVILTENDAEQLDMKELAAESWQSPVIITTLVQLLNTMFLGKTTSIRRFEALCDSVIVIDEVQSVPNNMLSLFNLTINFLSYACNTTFLLCSATQPCFENAKCPLLLSKNADVVPFDEKLWEPFKRTKILNLGSMKLEEIAEFCEETMEKCKSLLIVCNTKKDAELLFELLSSRNENCFYLSSSLCAAHRRDTLNKIYENLKLQKLICVSTQVIEAGVDISFECVIRFTAGMDSVIQSAGRCNRNHENDNIAPVYVVDCISENLNKLDFIKSGKASTIKLLDFYKNNKSELKNDLASDESISMYFRELYSSMMSADNNYQDYFIKRKNNTIFSMLSLNSKYYDDECDCYGKYALNQAFKMAGSNFEVIGSDNECVVVPYGKGKDLIEEFYSKIKYADMSSLRDWQQRIKPYTVSLYSYQKDKLAEGITCTEGVLILNPDYYDGNIGISFKIKSLFLEV